MGADAVIAGGFMASLALVTGALGWKLVPDTALYSRRGFHLWPSPFGDLLGTMAGRWGVLVASAVAAGVVVYLLPAGVPRALFVLVAGYWFLHPGVDSLGVLAVLLLERTGRRRWIVQAACVHPVAALVAWPRAIGADRRYLYACAVCAAGCIIGVGLADTFDTTIRYALPALALACCRLPRVLA
jgi:hypothetical protein